MSYVVVGGTVSERARIDQTIRSNFTTEEIRTTDGLVIEIGRRDETTAGITVWSIARVTQLRER